MFELRPEILTGVKLSSKTLGRCEIKNLQITISNWIGVKLSLPNCSRSLYAVHSKPARIIQEDLVDIIWR
jgi:hypothetical protein